MGSPVVWAVRRAIAAAATKKMLQARSARWNPEVSASGRATWRAARWLVREVAMAEEIANPRAAPSWEEAWIKEAARPALSGGTPALAAVWTATNTAPSPTDMINRPGSRSLG